MVELSDRGAAVVVLVVEVVPAVVELLVPFWTVELLLSGFTMLTMISLGFAVWFDAAEKATLLKMAPRVLSMELGRSPLEKTGKSSRESP